MNISTGGPHILLFERDQQLAALLISELQLAGYECHTARTAVEVFDAIARYPIRLVLVNLAQAAAARKEFWVALDTQRRDRKVQVFTFRCTNIAGYGPHDPDESGHGSMADMEIDGMMGLMSLVDAVRARVPGVGVETTTNTMPRMPRMQTPQAPAQPQPMAQRSPAQQVPISNNTGFASNGNMFRAAPVNDGVISQSPARPSTPTMPQTPANTPPTPAPVNTSLFGTQQAPAGTNGQNPAYTDKIRAVLYPNQRTWSSQSNGAFSTFPENRALSDTQNAVSPQDTGNPDSTVLQRMASGQIGLDGPSESSLAQLSRMAQGYQSSQAGNTAYSTYTPPESIQPVAPRNATTAYQQYQQQQSETISANTAYQQSEVRPSANGYSPAAETRIPEGSQSGIPLNYVAPAPRPAQTSENISAQPLRASPIQDIPIERNNGQAGSEGGKRPDVLSRTNYNPQTNQPAQGSQPLASIAASAPGMTAHNVTSPEETTGDEVQQNTLSIPNLEELQEKWKERNTYTQIDPAQAEALLERKPDFDASTAPNNAVLLDIVQSFPPMHTLAQQDAKAVQPQVLNGRATRSLGNVLLDGHLVPQDRLEVAQNIQRMLRGVDLNYQLGEILLMFKLLTPDQLLAASLVSYGLITTAQISALGRIRQELHAIGLEYDLENLLILFRILTPEQLREVRSSLQS